MSDIPPKAPAVPQITVVNSNSSKPWLTAVIVGVVILVVIIILVVLGWWIATTYFFKPAGQPCGVDWECQNGACGRLTAADNATKVCCPSGSTDTYGGYDYCTEMPMCSVCFSNAMCADGLKCSNNETGDKGNCAAKNNGKINDCCGVNSDCANNACGRTSTESTVDYCCPSGKTVYRASNARDYCTDNPDGTPCFDDDMCLTGKSYCNIPSGQSTGICTAKQPVGSSCSADDQCGNGACGRQTAAEGAPLICCPSGDTDLYDAYYYCTGMPNGSVCWSDAMCANGICVGNGGGVQRGVCSGNLPPNSSCQDNGECANKACGRQTAAEGAPLICCPSGDFDTYGGFDYCTQMPNGSTCWSDAMCASTHCRNNCGGFCRGTCGP